MSPLFVFLKDGLIDFRTHMIFYKAIRKCSHE